MGVIAELERIGQTLELHGSMQTDSLGIDSLSEWLVEVNSTLLHVGRPRQANPADVELTGPFTMSQK